MEQQLIEMLQRLPIAARIITQIDLEGAVWYCWQAGEGAGKSQDFVEAVEQAIMSVFSIIATDAGYSAEDFKHISHTTLYN
jgi:hypothetical protein